MRLFFYTSPLLAVLVLCRQVAAANSTDNEPTLPLSPDSAFDFNFLIALSDTLTGGLDIAPILAAAFNKVIAALPIPGKRVRIPAKEGNFTIETNWYAASKSQDYRMPALVIGNGFDAAQEDSYHYFVASALARGWNCITYEGPGHPTMR
ncbi:hypothetical protein QQZ08_004587 [Neonectria magnoliae]|uniref:Uncharacterized protein n=1 Tax=Neonectria magnoliae TaxID=2732573 RepID=A0ABR1I5H7_9HYPO